LGGRARSPRHPVLHRSRPPRARAGTALTVPWSDGTVPASHAASRGGDRVWTNQIGRSSRPISPSRRQRSMSTVRSGRSPANGRAPSSMRRFRRCGPPLPNAPSPRVRSAPRGRARPPSSPARPRTSRTPSSRRPAKRKPARGERRIRRPSIAPTDPATAGPSIAGGSPRPPHWTTESFEPPPSTIPTRPHASPPRSCPSTRSPTTTRRACSRSRPATCEPASTR